MSKSRNPKAPAAGPIVRLKAFFKGIPGWLLELWRRRSVDQLSRLVNFAGIVVAIGWFIPLVFSHVKMITQPGPQEYNEPAIWQVTWLLDHGRNPYTIAELPGAAYCFGPLYNYVVIAFKPLLGLDYPAHRMVVLIFLLASLWLIVRVMQKAGAGLGIALLSAVFYYWMSLGNIEITARPDTLGLCFFLLGIYVPWERGYTRWSTIVGLGCALVAFQCKSYFALAGCATLLSHFIVRDKREACWLGVGFFALLGLTFWLSCHFYPYYYIETVIVQRGGAIVNWREDVSLMHTLMLFQRGWPFFLLMGCGLVGWLWQRQVARRQEKITGRIDKKARRGELRFLAMGTVFIIFLSLVYFYMGHNAGAYFTYHLHLLFPLMFLLAAHAASQRWFKIGFGLILIVFVTVFMDIPGVPDSSAAYHRLERLVFDTHAEVLGIACVTDIFERDNRRVLHNGNTMFIGFAFADNRAERDPMVGALARRYNGTEADVRAKVAGRNYAMVLTEFDEPYFCDPELLKRNYDKVEQVDYFTYFGHSPVRVWRPKPKDPVESSAP